MKRVIFFVFLSLSSIAGAQQADLFRHDALCAESANSFQSEISQIEQVSADDKKTIFRLVMTYGRCQTFEDVKYPIKLQRRMLQLSNYGLNYPGKKTHAKIESYELLSETELEARISIKNDSIREGSRRRFVFRFWAQDWVGFPWTLSFEKKDNQIELGLKGFKPL